MSRYPNTLDLVDSGRCVDDEVSNIDRDGCSSQYPSIGVETNGGVRLTESLQEHLMVGDRFGGV